jgi:hypothetical protein
VRSTTDEHGRVHNTIKQSIEAGWFESTGVTSRGSKSAYCVMPHREEIERALADLPADAP